MTWYEGTLFGFNYAIEKRDNDEFIAWLVAKLKVQNPLLGKILDALLNESPAFIALKEVHA